MKQFQSLLLLLLDQIVCVLSRESCSSRLILSWSSCSSHSVLALLDSVIVGPLLVLLHHLLDLLRLEAAHLRCSLNCGLCHVALDVLLDGIEAGDLGLRVADKLHGFLSEGLLDLLFLLELLLLFKSLGLVSLAFAKHSGAEVVTALHSCGSVAHFELFLL